MLSIVGGRGKRWEGGGILEKRHNKNLSGRGKEGL